ncbi:hypothetical protein C8J57DRAFT_1304727 [Mycena rebaudengoi]|nr:hypothetical protein C8J57DRAFT_1304727 [Mycena rebaudengoi]
MRSVSIFYLPMVLVWTTSAAPLHRTSETATTARVSNIYNHGIAHTQRHGINLTSCFRNPANRWGRLRPFSTIKS